MDDIDGWWEVSEICASRVTWWWWHDRLMYNVMSLKYMISHSKNKENSSLCWRGTAKNTLTTPYGAIRHVQGLSCYDTKTRLILRHQFYRSGEYRESFCHYPMFTLTRRSCTCVAIHNPVACISSHTIAWPLCYVWFLSRLGWNTCPGRFHKERNKAKKNVR